MAGDEEAWQRFVANGDGSADADVREFAQRFAGQTVCVAGAGGDIGSALVRALAGEELRALILLDSSEHGLFEIQRQLEAQRTRVECECVLGSVDDGTLVREIFQQWQPGTVFHAAAFKHVGLLEHSPFEAVRNNGLGTYRLLTAAQENGTERFVLLSTDKAVKPHSVMGVSKRIAELVTVALSGEGSYASAVRLGNVIGSRGSVVPIFRKQIERGEAVSVTDAAARRYFLTRGEAVKAILAAGAAACDGKILIPEMGKPVVVAELARFLVNRYGRNGDGELRFTGLQPGEKLSEDLIGKSERRVGTVDGPLTVVETERKRADKLERAIERLARVAAERDRGGLLAVLCELVPDYEPSELMLA